jgi:peptide/nickel transport system substrate-binding protein
LAFSISTADSPDLKQTADMIRDQWAAIGAVVTINVFEPGDLNQSVIVPRKYDSLLFGESVGWDLDLYPFWHSSQRNAPGFNIAMYVNSTADKLLTDARSNLDPVVRAQDYAAFDTEIGNDLPAVFVYSPDFVYIMPDNVKGVETNNPIDNASDRWNGVSKWYIATDNIWKIFAQ